MLKDSKERIIKVRRNNKGEITSVFTDYGNIYSIDDAIVLAKNHGFGDINVGKAKDGTETLRNSPNSRAEYNLENLPLF